MIDLRSLPKEVADIIELKEQTDNTFSRFCVSENELLFINGGISEAKNLCVGDVIPGDDGALRKVAHVSYIKKQSLTLYTDCMGKITISEDHLMVLASCELKSAKNIVVGDVLLPINCTLIEGGSYNEGVFVGAYLADGNCVDISRNIAKSGYGTCCVKITNTDLDFLTWLGEFAVDTYGFTSFSVHKRKSCNTLLLYGAQATRKFYKMYGVGVGRRRREFLQKQVPYEKLLYKEFLKGFLDGFSSCDLSFGGKKTKSYAVYSIKSPEIFSCVLFALRANGVFPNTKQNKHKNTNTLHWIVHIPSKQFEHFAQSLDLKTTHKRIAKNEALKRFYERNVAKSLRTSNECRVNDVRMPVVTKICPVGEINCVDFEIDGNKLFSNSMGIVSHNCDEDYTDILWNVLAERADPGIEHSFIASFFGLQGSGKSLSAISLCCFLDPNFSVDNIFFDYNHLVYNRHKLKPNSAVLVDEQSQSFGLDSHRVMIILSSLKEQLRKKSIHFIFCAPNLYEEYKSSMYLFETMFIDYETQECYAALKTRDGLTLGHVRIPYPLKVLDDGRSLASKELVDAYQKKKDDHLEKVLGNAGVDIYEERAQVVMNDPLFKRAERKYKVAMGYMPQSTCIQIINKLFPEYNAGVVPVEIAGRIKLDKELSGEWDIAGKGSKKADRQRVRRKK